MVTTWMVFVASGAASITPRSYEDTPPRQGDFRFAVFRRQLSCDHSWVTVADHADKTLRASRSRPERERRPQANSRQDGGRFGFEPCVRLRSNASPRNDQRPLRQRWAD